MWRIDNRLKLQQFKEVPRPDRNFYLADGNHRIDSSSQYAQNWKKNKDIMVTNLIILFWAI